MDKPLRKISGGIMVVASSLVVVVVVVVVVFFPLGCCCSPSSCEVVDSMLVFSLSTTTYCLSAAVAVAWFVIMAGQRRNIYIRNRAD